MQLFDTVLDALAAKLQKRIQGRDVSQAYRDAGRKGSSFSVESLVAENVAALMLLNFSLPISGQSSRAKWLDEISDNFTGRVLEKAQAQALLTGDCLVIPSWNGRGVDYAIVDASRFAILGASGDELLSVAYIVDEKKMRNGRKYTLLRTVELKPYTAEDGSRLYGNRYRTFIAEDGTIAGTPLSKFPDWAETNEEDWFVPNTDGLLIARIKSPTVDPNDPNAMKGVPLCFGASEPIREIHYLTDQMHQEFQLSEKAILADKRLFRRDPVTNSNGEVTGYRLTMPKGRERLFMSITGNGQNPEIKEWAPTIQLQPYLDNLDFQFKRVEKCIGCDSGVISTPNDLNYQNVDNVRKSTIHTQSLINNCRKITERALLDLVKAWDTLANYYGITPIGDYEVMAKWSDDYINTFADQQNAILAGQAIGATDAYDYRAFVMGESPETARARVEEIKAAKGSEVEYYG